MRRRRKTLLPSLSSGGLLILILLIRVAFEAGSVPWPGTQMRMPAWMVHTAWAAHFQATNQLVVIAFSDTTGQGPFECPGCDKIYSQADRDANAQDPLPEMEFVVRRADTREEIARQRGHRDSLGRIQAVFQLPSDIGTVILELATAPAGFQLCPNSTASRTIHPEDFVLGTHEEIFPFWKGCAVQPAPTATPTVPPPTATPVPPTPTSTPAEQQIVVEAFLDVTGPGGLACPGCDRIYSSADQAANAVNPLPNMDFLLKEATTGRLLARQTTTLDTQGRARTVFRVPGDLTQELIVELAAPPAGFELCPNMSRTRRIRPGDFILGTHLEQFPFWRGCLLPSPTPTGTAAVPAEASPTPPRATPTVVKPRVTPTVTQVPASPTPRSPTPRKGATGTPVAETRVTATVTFTPTATAQPQLPITGGPITPLWGLLALGAAVLLALSHLWRWIGAAFAGEARATGSVPAAVEKSPVPSSDEKDDSQVMALLGLAVALISLGVVLLRTAWKRLAQR